MPNFFLVSVSNLCNLQLCMNFNLAGFPHTASGFWTYLEIEEGDFVSFLFGAQLWNLYTVERKIAVQGSDDSPPWIPVGRNKVYFPFRLKLKPIRHIRENLIRNEFSSVAEGLMPRTGYRKTHFQGDQATLETVRQMGQSYDGDVAAWEERGTRFTPKIHFETGSTGNRKVYQFNEFVLQALAKKHLRDLSNIEGLLSTMGLTEMASCSLEVLGETALPEGQVDVVVKPVGDAEGSELVAVEVKKERASKKDVEQLRQYMNTIETKGLGGALIARAFAATAVCHSREMGLNMFTYDFNSINRNKEHTFEDLLAAFVLHPA